MFTLGYTLSAMRAFMDLLDARAPIVAVGRAEWKRAPELLDAFRRAGILRPTGQDGIEEVSVPDVVRVLRVLYGAQGRGLRILAQIDLQPMVLGYVPDPGGERELVLAVGGERGVSSVTSRGRRTLALVPTARGLRAELRKRHGPGAHVTIEVLEETLSVRDGRLARSASCAPDAPDHAPAASGVLFPGASSWNDVRIGNVDASTIHVAWAGRRRYVTFVDIGWASKGRRRPKQQWDVLQHICDNDGIFKSRRFGNARATKKAISRLRIALCALFGLPHDPFDEYVRGAGWRVLFQAGDHDPEGERELSPGARATLKRAGKLLLALQSGRQGREDLLGVDRSRHACDDHVEGPDDEHRAPRCVRFPECEAEGVLAVRRDSCDGVGPGRPDEQVSPLAPDAQMSAGVGAQDSADAVDALVGEEMDVHRALAA